MQAFKIILTIAILILIVCDETVIADNTKEDVIYLNNGGMIRGNLLEAIPDSIVKIEAVNGSILVINMQEITKITSANTTEKQHYVDTYSTLR